jgi:hypothetical protein
MQYQMFGYGYGYGHGLWEYGFLHLSITIIVLIDLILVGVWLWKRITHSDVCTKTHTCGHAHMGAPEKPVEGEVKG